MGENLPSDGTRIRTLSPCGHASSRERRQYKGRHLCLWYSRSKAYTAPSSDFFHFSDEDEEKIEEREGWETVQLDGQTVGIRTSAIEEKCQAFETLVIYCSTLQARFAPYLSQSLELTLPSLRFYFHDGVREACAMYVLQSLPLFFVICC